MLAALPPPSPRHSRQNPATTTIGVPTSSTSDPAAAIASQPVILRCRDLPASTCGLSHAPSAGAIAPQDTATPIAADDQFQWSAPRVSRVGSSAPAPRL